MMQSPFVSNFNTMYEVTTPPLNNFINNAPTHYNGIPIKRSWKDSGCKAQSKNLTVFPYNNFKLGKCPNGYVLLCIGIGCKNLAININFKCKNHNSGKEVYTYCRNYSCLTGASYGFEYKKPLFCKPHREINMINVVSKRCEKPDCKRQPSFGYKDQPPRYCSEHKEDGMIDVNNKQCKNCTKRPTFGLKGQFAEYCAEHKSDEMIDVNNKICEHDNCGIRAVFGNKGEKAKFCKEHKTKEMLDVKSKLCEKSNCRKRPGFGYKDQGAKYCSEHKEEGMIDLYNKKCGHCNKHPVFGYEGGIAQYCEDHKHGQMIDVYHKPCEFLDCTVRPSYAKLYSKELVSCVGHSSLNYYSKGKLNPTCQIVDCQNIAYFVDPEDSNVYPIRCNIHCLSTDVELINKTCFNCDQELYFPSNRKICMNCGCYRERKLIKFKETIVKHFFTSNNIPFIHDKRISSNGSKYRPDFVINSVFGYIIVEVDEHQHKKEYNQEDQINRMRIIYHDIQIIKPNSQVLFVRFNPDVYTGLQLKVKERHLYLYNIIMYLINQVSINMLLGQTKLFFDGFDGSPNIECIC